MSGHYESCAQCQFCDDIDWMEICSTCYRHFCRTCVDDEKVILKNCSEEFMSKKNAQATKIEKHKQDRYDWAKNCIRAELEDKPEPPEPESPALSDIEEEEEENEDAGDVYCEDCRKNGKSEFKAQVPIFDKSANPEQLLQFMCRKIGIKAEAVAIEFAQELFLEEIQKDKERESAKKRVEEKQSIEASESTTPTAAVSRQNSGDKRKAGE